MENTLTRSCLTLLPLLALACGEEPSESLAGKWQEVAGGQRDRGSPNVVLLFNWDSSNPVGTLHTCTAELVAPDVLLTAAHCLAGNSEFYAAYLGDDGNALGSPIDPGKANVRNQLHLAKEWHAHPQYVTTNGYNDIGVVILEEPITDIEPLPINRVKPTPAMLSDVSIVGYGKTHDRDTSFAVTKYRADGLTATLDPTQSITVGDEQRHACVGDSGGPVFAKIDGVLTIIGTDSYSDETGDASRCRMASHYQRVDPYLAFLDKYIPPAAPPKDAGAARDAGADASLRGKDAGDDASTADAGRAADAGEGRDAATSAEPPRKDAGISMRRDAGEADPEDEDEDDEEEDDDVQPQSGSKDGCNLGGTSGASALWLLALAWCTRRRKSAF